MIASPPSPKRSTESLTGTVHRTLSCEPTSVTVCAPVSVSSAASDGAKGGSALFMGTASIVSLTFEKPSELCAETRTKTIEPRQSSAKHVRLRTCSTLGRLVRFSWTILDWYVGPANWSSMAHSTRYRSTRSPRLPPFFQLATTLSAVKPSGPSKPSGPFCARNVTGTAGVARARMK